MRTYNCLVQLGANKGGPNPHHEVPRVNVPRAEIVLLRALHGADAVKDLVAVGETPEELEDMDIYRSMAERYPKHVNLIERLNNVVLEDFSFADDDLERGLEEELPAEQVLKSKEGVPPMPAEVPVGARRQPIDELA